MGRFRLEIVVELNAQEFFENRFTVNFQAIFCEVCDLKSVELIREWDEDGVNCKLIRSTPNQELPILFQKILGKTSGFIDEVHQFVKSTPPYEIQTQSKLPTLSDKVDIHSNMVVYPIDPRSCQIILEGSITARVFGIGSIIENAYITGIKETYNRLPLVVTTWKSTKLIGTIRPLTQEDSIKEEEFFAASQYPGSSRGSAGSDKTSILWNQEFEIARKCSKGSAGTPKPLLLFLEEATNEANEFQSSTQALLKENLKEEELVSVPFTNDDQLLIPKSQQQQQHQQQQKRKYKVPRVRIKCPSPFSSCFPCINF